ncbi:MAG: hypothetical protein IJ001_10650 [Oscillospiraceae bacterium]|nr:hypothetical protein [Oscillospiraceae bacterium]
MKGNVAPKTVPQRIVFTALGVLLMATTMATYNKYLVYGEFSVNLFRQVGIAFLQKAPVAFLLQFFVVQKFAGKQAAKYPTDNKILYQCIRTGFTVLVMCPIMCFYSNIINMIQFHWTVWELLEAWISKMPINWIFAFGVQIWVLGPVNRFLFSKIFAKELAKA